MALGNLPLAADGLPLVPIGSDIREVLVKYQLNLTKTENGINRYLTILNRYYQ